MASIGEETLVATLELLEDIVAEGPPFGDRAERILDELRRAAQDGALGDPNHILSVEVHGYAQMMELRLMAKDAERGRGQWRRDPPASLFEHLSEEVAELKAVAGGGIPKGSSSFYLARVAAEAADVGNLAMMISDAVSHQAARNAPATEDS